MDYEIILKKLDIESCTSKQFTIFKSCIEILMSLLGKSSIDELKSKGV